MRLILILLWATTATAQTADGPQWPDCFCTDKERNRHELGQRTCLTVGGRSFWAECQMSLNTPMWRELKDEICPIA